MTDATSLNECAEMVKRRAPQFFRAVMLAPPEKRGQLFAMIALDIELWAAANASQEEMVNAIKLAWWAEALARMPESEKEHIVLSGLNEAGAPLDVAKQMVSAFQEGRESLPILINASADHLGADRDEMRALISTVAENSHKPRKWPEEARPLVAMLVPLSRWQSVKLAFFGRA